MTIDPYSPMHLEKASVIPVNKAGNKLGKIIFENVIQEEAPSDQDASSISFSIVTITG